MLLFFEANTLKLTTLPVKRVDYISHVSVSLLRNSNVLNRVYLTHIKKRQQLLPL